ncbi:hypothetical protein [Formosa algae]|uniref:hypothetical protein n=1 Tax=Formosa algae TaxID=225843 RepID=UPI000CCE37F7|nr:hypothetical protein [Formosa algae]PNW27876.1 hypothetical protein BKP44_10610 [Formosa algae]
MMDLVNEILNQIKLNKYDEQKFKLSYYLGRFQALNDKPDTIDESLNYLKNNLTQIISFDESAILPWLNYLYNLKDIKTLELKSLIGQLKVLYKTLKMN